MNKYVTTWAATWSMLLVFSLVAAVRGQSTPPADDVSLEILGDLRPLLLREPAVRQELKLRDEQARDIDTILGKIDGPLFRLRHLDPAAMDVVIEGATPEKQSAARTVTISEKALEELRSVERGWSAIERILDADQRERLNQIAWQAEGLSALTRPEVASRLGLVPEQREQIRGLLARLNQSMRQLDKLASEGEPPAVLARAADKLQSQHFDQMMEALTAEQRQRWADLPGKPFDLSRLGPRALPAPELIEGTWINSEPLTLADLRGRVVIVHFWTFGCINCIRNWPAYRKWMKAFADREVTIIGIHTPETAREHDLEQVRTAVRENELAFPILIDNDKRNWLAWGNGVWPSVYLIDRQGRVRHWWYGELNWGDRQGEKLMRSRIEALLREEPPHPASRTASNFR
jgi:peroxiredoxin